MNQNRTVFDIDEETDAFYLQKAVEYHEWLIQQEAQPRLTRTPIFRDREDAERRLRADYFDDHYVTEKTIQWRRRPGDAVEWRLAPSTCCGPDVCDIRTSYVNPPALSSCTSSDGDNVAPCLLRRPATADWLLLPSSGTMVYS
ncbi:hypothetical protein Tco_0111236 [Tanacetum coccineum]